MFTQEKTKYTKNVEKFMKPQTHIRNLRGFEWDEKNQVIVVTMLVSDMEGDLDIDFIEYTKDQYAELCGFSSREVAEEAVQRYKATQEEAKFEKRFASD